MKYPINVEKYIEAVRIEFGDHKWLEYAYRRIIPIINTAYSDGTKGRHGYPICLNERARYKDSELACLIQNWTNEAYEQGRRDAQKAAAV